MSYRSIHIRWLLPAVILSTIGLCAVLAWRSWAFSLPAPERADRDGLFRWLVLRDVPQEPWSTQLALVDRLEQEVERGVDVQGSR
jgi:hypothetical protein